MRLSNIALVFTAPAWGASFANMPTLDLNFVDQFYAVYENKAFSDIITFTRGTNATLFDSSGTLVWAPNNAIRNNTMVGAVAGTPGTLPTNWARFVSGTGATAVIGTGTESGIAYIDIAFSGGNTDGISFFIDGTTGHAALNGQTWTGSAYYKLIAGSFANCTINHVVYEANSSGTALASAPTSLAAVTTAGLASQRITATRTNNNASTAEEQFAIVIAGTGAFSFTLRIGMPQLERGSVATAVNATSGTAYFGPRLDYDPSTLAARGLLIEEQRTNLLLQSEDFATTWTTSLSPTITTNTTIAPDGTTTADTLASTVVGSYVAQVVTFTGDGTKTFSIFIKAGTSNRSVIFIRDTTASASKGAAVITWTGGVPSVVVTSGSLQYLQACPNGWYRLAIIVDSVVAANTNQFRIQPDNISGTGDIVVWGAQAENGTFSTSYIPTTTTALTRSADVASVNTLTPWYNATEGTLFAEAQSPNAAAFFAAQTYNDGSAANELRQSTNSAGANPTFSVAVSSVSQAGIGVSLAAGTAYKIASAYALNDFNSAVNGTLGTPDTSGTVPTVNKLSLGVRGNSTMYLNGHLRRITYYPRRLSNAELQAITTP